MIPDFSPRNERKFSIMEILSRPEPIPETPYVREDIFNGLAPLFDTCEIGSNGKITKLTPISQELINQLEGEYTGDRTNDVEIIAHFTKSELCLNIHRFSDYLTEYRSVIIMPTRTILYQLIQSSLIFGTPKDFIELPIGYHVILAVFYFYCGGMITTNPVGRKSLGNFYLSNFGEIKNDMVLGFMINAYGKYFPAVSREIGLDNLRNTEAGSSYNTERDYYKNNYHH